MHGWVEVFLPKRDERGRGIPPEGTKRGKRWARVEI
jgi:hypothetical protein